MPRNNAEKRSHLGGSAADDLRVEPEAFKPEGELVPDLVGDYLIIRRLQHEAYLGALRAQVDIVKLPAAKHDTAAFCSCMYRGLF